MSAAETSPVPSAALSSAKLSGVRADAADTSSTMHAKCVVVDDREVLITSANFTGRAQHANVELGVLIRDSAFASRVSGQWRALVTHGLFRAHG